MEDIYYSNNVDINAINLTQVIATSLQGLHNTEESYEKNPRQNKKVMSANRSTNPTNQLK